MTLLLERLIQPTVGAIAERIHQDQLTNLTYPQCKKVAVQVVKRLKAEWVIKQPNEKLVKASDKYPNENNVTPIKQGEKTGGDTVAENRPSDRTATVANDRSGTVKTVEKKDTVQAIDYGALEKDSFDKLYAHISGLVKAKKLKPSARELATETHKFIKEDSQLKKTAVSLPECRYLANQVRDKMLMEQVIIDNPKYKNGLPKYLVA